MSGNQNQISRIIPKALAEFICENDFGYTFARATRLLVIYGYDTDELLNANSNDKDVLEKYFCSLETNKRAGIDLLISNIFTFRTGFTQDFVSDTNRSEKPLNINSKTVLVDLFKENKILAYGFEVNEVGVISKSQVKLEGDILVKLGFNGKDEIDFIVDELSIKTRAISKDMNSLNNIKTMVENIINYNNDGQNTKIKNIIENLKKKLLTLEQKSPTDFKNLKVEDTDY